jgi:Uma2 family endonuclease
MGATGGVMAQSPVVEPRAPAHRFSVAEYYAMAEAGILGEDDRVELLEGEVVQMVPIGSQHNAIVDRIAKFLWSQIDDHAIARIQGSIRLDQHSEPQPDVALLRYRPDFYADAHPGPVDILLIIEVMQTSADYDRTVKAPLYARSGIAELWLVDLEADVIEVLRSPREGQYRERMLRKRGETIELSGEVTLQVQVGDLLG